MTATPEAWEYFMAHHDNIRECVEKFLPVEQWQSMAGPFGSKTLWTIEDFDKAVKNNDNTTLVSIMDDTWGRAPEDRSVYQIPGFTEMCNLLDETVEGFHEDP
jgi:hypothetical protein